MAVYSSDEHEVKWTTINRRLWTLGYWVRWQYDFMTAERKYAIGKEGEKKPMGIYEDEATAMGMVKMILSNANYEGEMK